MARLIGSNKTAARISEYEHGTRQPDLVVLLRYARLAAVPMETLVDDKLNLKLSTGELGE